MKKKKRFNYNFEEEEDFYTSNKSGNDMWAQKPRKQKPKVKKFKYKDL